jgi:hypothetical protein
MVATPVRRLENLRRVGKSAQPLAADHSRLSRVVTAPSGIRLRGTHT